MSEPTIDEMLEWLDSIQGEYDESLDLTDVMSTNIKYPLIDGIRAILEQHRYNRDLEKAMPMKFIEEEKDLEQMKLEAIRAFVERVEKKVTEVDEYDFAAEAWSILKEELAVIEKELK